MVRPIRFLLAVILLSTQMAGCSLISRPTPEPIIIVASPTPSGGGAQPTAQGQQPATPTTDSGQPTPAATQAAGDPTSPPATPEPAGGTITVAFDAFPSYYPAILIETQELLKKRGYELQLVPFALGEQNDFSEQERFDKLRSGEWDVLATTLDGFARQSDPSIGAITAVIDESAGADKLVAKPEIATINDLAGKRIAYSEGSVGEYFLYYSLSLAGLTPQDVTLVPAATVADAVQSYLDGNADAVSAWEPDVLAAEEQGGKVLIASDKLRAILDVLVSSRRAIQERPDALQAFHEAWFEALRLMIDQPAEAEQAIINWGNNDWTTIAQPGDLQSALGTLAQATLNANQLAFRTPDILVARLREAQKIWAAAGQNVPQSDLPQLVEGRFVTQSAQNPALLSTQAPVNSSFLLTTQIDLPQLSSEEQQSAQEIVKLPLEKIDFLPDSLRLTDKARQDLLDQVVPVLRSSRLYLRIEGSAAWPATGGFSAEDIRSFAEQRAVSVATFLGQQGINPNRLIIGTLDPKFPQSSNEEELTQDRIVRFTLVSPQGR